MDPAASTENTCHLQGVGPGLARAATGRGKWTAGGKTS